MPRWWMAKQIAIWLYSKMKNFETHDVYHSKRIESPDEYLAKTVKFESVRTEK